MDLYCIQTHDSACVCHLGSPFHNFFVLPIVTQAVPEDASHCMHCFISLSSTVAEKNSLKLFLVNSTDRTPGVQERKC